MTSISTPTISARTKHLQLRKAFAADLIAREIISLHYVPTSDLIADVLTKGTSKATHNKLIALIQQFSA